MRHQEGVTLIEAIASIVLLGIIATVASFFLASGLQGYLFSKRSSETAPKVQVALERINLELSNALDRNGTGTIGFATNTSVAYQSSILPNDRTIRYDSATSRLLLHNGVAEFLLLDNVAVSIHPPVRGGNPWMVGIGTLDICFNPPPRAGGNARRSAPLGS